MGIDHKESGNPGLYSRTMKSDFWGYFFSILVAQVHLKHLIEMGRSHVHLRHAHTQPILLVSAVAVTLQGSITLGT